MIKSKGLTFPQDKIQAEVQKKVSEKLDGMSAASGAGSDASEKTEKVNNTIADDFDLTAEQAETIQTTEGIARELFNIMGGNYDALIAMDGKSSYSRIVNEHPLLLERVKTAKNPVLEAVRLAVAFKPFNEFMDKYGKTPDEIRKAMRAELEEELSVKKNPAPKVKENEASTPVFSTYGAAASKGEKVGKEVSFSDVFKK